MKRNIRKIETLVLSILLLGTVFFVPASSVNVKNIKNLGEIFDDINEIEDINEVEGAIELIDFDTRFFDNLAIKKTNNGDNDDAGYKSDAGDKISRASHIFPNEVKDNWPGRGVTGKLDSEDVDDWYEFYVCEGQDIIISMTPPNGYDFDLGLYDRFGKERATSTNTGSNPESITFPADITDKWYLDIKFISGTGQGQYTFDVSISGQNDAGTGDDAGDDFATATLITPGTYEGFLDMNDEEDWYKFDVDEGQGIHFILEMKKNSYFSDFDIYLYKPSGELAYYEKYYYDDELLYPADVSGEWRAKIDIFPGYTDIPEPTEWDYFTYGSGGYELEFILESSAPDPPGPIQQPDITPIAQTFKIENDPISNKDEYGYLASVPACNYLDGGDRYMAPIVYTGDNTPTNWFGTVDDTTDYLLDDWNVYLSENGRSATEYNVPKDPIQAAADIATKCWESSDLAVVAVDGSDFVDTTDIVLQRTKFIRRTTKVETIPSSSSKFQQFGGYFARIMILGPRWGAIHIAMKDALVEPQLLGIYPHFMPLGQDWWPEHSGEKKDIYHPVPRPGIYAPSVLDTSGDWDMVITKFACHRHKIQVTNPDSVLSVKVTTKTPEDLLVYLVDPEGFLRAPDPPYWNGGPINPIHGWNGMDNSSLDPPVDQWQTWEPEKSTEFSAEVLHPEKGTWQAIVVPRYPPGQGNPRWMRYTITGTIKTLDSDRINAAESAANAAVIASQEHAPLLFVTKDSIPSATQNAFNELGVKNVIFVQSGGIGSVVESSLPNIQSNLKSMDQIVDHIKSYDQSENFITITSLKSGNGYFAPSAMLAAYHCSPVLRIGEAPDNPAGQANKIDTWRMWAGDYYHGNRAPAHLPIHNEPVEEFTPSQLLLELIKFLIRGEADLPPFGLDAKRYWCESLHDSIHDWVADYGLDNPGQEAYVFVAPRNDIRLLAAHVMLGNNSYAGQIPGYTTAYINDIIVRNVLYPALIFANPNKDVATTQLMNFPDIVGAYNRWTTNDGVLHSKIASSHENKRSFSSHNRIYEGHCLWDAHLERLNEGAHIMYYSGHGTGGSGISAQLKQTDMCDYPDQIWPDAWRGYRFDYWETARDDGTRWFNPEPPLLYDIIHYKWQDQLYENLRSLAVFYQSCSTGQQFGPMIYLDHGAVVWYGNAETGSCPPSDLVDDWFFEDLLINGDSIGEAYTKHMWKIIRDFTSGDEDVMYGTSSIFRYEEGDDGIPSCQIIYGDPTLRIYSPEWTIPIPVDSALLK